MAKPYAFGHKPVKRRWDASEIDPEHQDREIARLFIGLVLMFILLTLFRWWLGNALR
ncbi:MAG: hypothetical protein ACE5FT_02755 [Candidatus Nanoarchaeia archaeon]